jgi:hypothetical protein
VKSARGWLVAILAIIIAFGVGYGWQYTKVVQVQKELAATRAQLQVQTLYVELGQTAFEAQRGNYEQARREASAFFTALQSVVDSMSVDQKTPFEPILAERDNVITALSRANPDAADMLSGLFARIRGEAPPAMRTPAESTTQPAPATTQSTPATAKPDTGPPTP